MLVFLVLVVMLELIWGDWLKLKHPLSQFNIPYGKTVEFDPRPLYANGDSIVYYTRDMNGLRGTCFSDLEEIDILTIGGSTTDQRYITDTATWQEVLAREWWHNSGERYCIANAGLDGHSTFGHLKAMDDWILPMEELKPRYILFYIGLNDMYLEGETNDDGRFRKQSVSLLQRNSVVYRSVKRMFKAQSKGRNELGHGGAELEGLEYTQKGLMSEKQLTQLTQTKIIAYRQRLEGLITKAEKMGAKVVFVSQPSFRYIVSEEQEVKGVSLVEDKWSQQFNGMDFYNILLQMNRAMEVVAKSNGAMYINLSEMSIWDSTDFYDFMHMTPRGTKKLGKAIARKWTPTIEKESTEGTR